jgi:hypothetical protein
LPGAQQDASGAAPWPFARRWLLGFGFAFLLLAHPSPFRAIPGLASVLRWLQALWNVVVPFAATHIFHVRVTLPAAWNDSVDTTFHYVQYAVWAFVAAAIATLWGTLERKAAHSERAYRLFHLYVRYALALAMLKYGAAKVMLGQFPYPALDTLVEPYGSSSPMGLAWVFMGMSPALKFATGAAEMLSGFLLTIRRTTLLGGLLAMAMLSTVVAMNYCYDLPVKTYSTLLMLMAFIVVWPDRRRLANLFVLNRTVDPIEIRPLSPHPRVQAGLLVARTLAVAAFALLALRSEQQWRKEIGDLAPRSPLRGIWNVVELTPAGDRWRRLVFDGPRFMSIFDLDDNRHLFRVKVDQTRKTITLTNEDDPSDMLSLVYDRPDPRTLVVDTLVRGHRLHAICRLMDERQFVLTSRRFHWVTEVPFFR